MTYPLDATERQAIRNWRGSLGPPYAEITQVGRWTYAIRLHFDLMMTEPAWHRLGRRRAQRKARKELARHLRREQRERGPVRIYDPEGQPS